MADRYYIAHGERLATGVWWLRGKNEGTGYSQDLEDAEPWTIAEVEDHLETSPDDVPFLAEDVDTVAQLRVEFGVLTGLQRYSAQDISGKPNKP